METTYDERSKALKAAATYESGGPELMECDIVMKGGITSGVVYPLAVCEIAAKYRFRRIGGTSAGAIAAAATAAAEYRRQTGEGDGFATIAKLPAWLGDDDNLFHMFEPEDKTRALFASALAMTGPDRSKLASALAGLKKAMRVYFWPWIVIGLLPAIAFGGLFLGLANQDSDVLFGRALLPTLAVPFGLAGTLLLALLWPSVKIRWVSFGLLAIATVLGLVEVFTGGPDRGGGWVALIVGELLLLVIGLILALVAAVARSVFLHIPANRYGMCSGMGTERALTPWLTGYLEEVAFGQKADANGGKPLTFGDLWTANSQLDAARRDAEASAAYLDPARRNVDFRAISTNLTLGRPYEFPLAEEGRRKYWFDVDDFKALFPAHVVQWMLERPAKDKHGAPLAPPLLASRPGHQPPNALKLHPLPDPADLPVVVAARMSLSFPVLLSAVPLWRVEVRQHKESAAGAAATDWHGHWSRCWFSDGGISSNFPVHLFDDPLPGSPTFALNLRGVHPDFPIVSDESKNVFLPTEPLDGKEPSFNHFDAKNGTLPGFLGTVLDTARNWHDNSRLNLAAYRDRVAHLSLDSKEGGLNLRMPPETIRQLSERGWHAGHALVESFAGEGWERHRWRRYRATMEAASALLQGFGANLETEPGGAPSYPGMISAGKPRPSIRAEQRTDATARSRELAALGIKIATDSWYESGDVPDAPFSLELRPPM